MEHVNHPTHYNQSGRKECIEEMRDIFGDSYVFAFCILNSYKYLYRAGTKAGNSKEQDVDKAKWYFNYANNLLSGSDEYADMINVIREELNKYED